MDTSADPLRKVPQAWWREVGVRYYRRDYVAHLLRVTGRGWVVEYRRVDLSFVDPADEASVIGREVELMAMKRRERPAGEVPTGIPHDPETAGSMPELWERMTETTWEDGTPRRPDTLTLSVREGRWCGLLKDVDEGRILWTSAGTLHELLHLIEERCVEGDDWRVDKHWTPPPKGAGSRKRGSGKG